MSGLTAGMPIHVPTGKLAIMSNPRDSRNPKKRIFAPADAFADKGRMRLRDRQKTLDTICPVLTTEDL